MSWTDVFPVLDDEMVDAYEAGVTPEERAEYDDWFAVDRIINRSKAKHLVVFSLFWKNTRAEEPDLPPLTREVLMQAEEQGLVERFAPWSHYVQPLLNGAKRMREKRPDVGMRIYLAADLHFLIEDFTALGCEICLMKTSSVRHNPGAMWRFLALEDKRRLITVSDADRAPLVEADIQRTELMAKIGLGFWRVPVWGELNDKGQMNYRPVLACQFGSNKPLPAGQLMKALIWHTRKGSISNKCKPPGCGEQVIYGTQCPDYGFDEWFLQAAVYPRAARHGVLSFIPAAAKSRLLPIDIEYCTWANPRAEINYFGTDGKCCGGIAPALPASLKKWRVNHAKFPEPKWRNYNPGLVEHGGRLLMSYRSHPPERPGVKSVVSRLWLCELHSNLRTTGGHRELTGLRGSHQEDGRLLLHRGRLHLAYTSSEYLPGQQWQSSMQLAELTPGGKVRRHYDLRFGVNGCAREKNWQFFSDRKRLRFAYSVKPHVVFDLESKQPQGDLEVPEWGHGHPSGGTPPVRAGEVWISFFHAHQPVEVHQRKYTVGAYAFRDDAKVVAMTRQPLLAGDAAEGFAFDLRHHHWHPLCVFPCGAIYEEKRKRWLVSYGINDSFCGLFTIAHKELQRLLVPVR